MFNLDKEHHDHFCWLLDQDPDKVIDLLSSWKQFDQDKKYEYLKTVFGDYLEYYPTSIIIHALNTYIKGLGRIKLNDRYGCDIEIFELTKEETEISMFFHIHVFLDDVRIFSFISSIEDNDLGGETTSTVYRLIWECKEDLFAHATTKNLLGVKKFNLVETDIDKLKKLADKATMLAQLVDDCGFHYSVAWKEILHDITTVIKENSAVGAEVPTNIVEFLEYINSTNPHLVYSDTDGFVVNYYVKRKFGGVVLIKEKGGIIRRSSSSSKVYKRSTLARKMT